MEYNVEIGAVDITVEPVTLNQAKANSNIEHTDADTYLQMLLDGAIIEAENYTGTSILKRNVGIGASGWAKKMELPYNPISTISKVSYKNLAGTDIDLETADYKLYTHDNGTRQVLLFNLATFPDLEEDNPFPITITAIAGYLTAATVPADIKKAIMVMFSQAEMYREDVPTSVARTSRSLLRPYRKW